MKTSAIKSSSKAGSRKNSFSNNTSPLNILNNTKENRVTTNHTSNIFQIPDISSEWRYSVNDTSNLNQSTTANNTSESMKQNDHKQQLTTNVFINNLNIQIKPSSQLMNMGASNLHMNANKKTEIPQPTSGNIMKRAFQKSPQKIFTEHDQEDYKNIINSKIENQKKVSNANNSSNYIEKFMNNSNKQNYPPRLSTKNDYEPLNNRAIKITPPHSIISSKSTLTFKSY